MGHAREAWGKGSGPRRISGATPAPWEATQGAGRRQMQGASATSRNAAGRPGRGGPPWFGGGPSKNGAAPGVLRTAARPRSSMCSLLGPHPYVRTPPGAGVSAALALLDDVLKTSPASRRLAFGAVALATRPTGVFQQPAGRADGPGPPWPGKAASKDGAGPGVLHTAAGLRSCMGSLLGPHPYVRTPPGAGGSRRMALLASLDRRKPRACLRSAVSPCSGGVARATAPYFRK